MRYFIIIILFILTGCKSDISIDNIEEREHGLSYIKGTNTLVDGRVVRKFDDGNTAEINHFKNGMPVGDWVAYGYQGEIISHGFGTEIKQYETGLKGTDLNYCVLSICMEGGYTYATLYMDNAMIFTDRDQLLDLSKLIFGDYSDKYKINDLLFFDKKHEYSISKKVINNTNYIFDTIADSKIIKIHIH